MTMIMMIQYHLKFEEIKVQMSQYENNVTDARLPTNQRLEVTWYGGWLTVTHIIGGIEARPISSRLGHVSPHFASRCEPAKQLMQRQTNPKLKLVQRLNLKESLFEVVSSISIATPAHSKYPNLTSHLLVLKSANFNVPNHSHFWKLYGHIPSKPWIPHGCNFGCPWSILI